LALQAIRKLHVLGPGFGVTSVGGQRLVSSVPHSLSTDTNAVLELAQVPALSVMMTKLLHVDREEGWQLQRGCE
jgi:hypothetical protein